MVGFIRATPWYSSLPSQQSQTPSFTLCKILKSDCLHNFLTSMMKHLVACPPGGWDGLVIGRAEELPCWTSRGGRLVTRVRTITVVIVDIGPGHCQGVVKAPEATLAVRHIFLLVTSGNSQQSPHTSPGVLQSSICLNKISWSCGPRCGG